MIDTKTDYYNLNVINPNGVDVSHRLGNFKIAASLRKSNTPPSMVILHIPVADFVKPTGSDITAEWTAKYLSTIGASVHGCTDRDSYVKCLPIDLRSWGSGNSKVDDYAVNYEIAGNGKSTGESTETVEQWKSKTGILRFIQTAKCIIEGYKLVYPDNFKDVIPPRIIAEIDINCNTIQPGFSQHRWVPKKVGNQFYFFPNNLEQGQHADILEDFPFDLFFEVFNDELKLW